MLHGEQKEVESVNRHSFTFQEDWSRPHQHMTRDIYMKRNKNARHERAFGGFSPNSLEMTR